MFRVQFPIIVRTGIDEHPVARTASRRGCSRRVYILNDAFGCADARLGRGLSVLREHPASASRWRVPSDELLALSPVVGRAVSHTCARLELTVRRISGKLGPVYTPSRFTSRAFPILRRVDRECPGFPRHAQLLPGRASQAAIFPRRLCQLRGKRTREQIELDCRGLVSIPARDQGVAVDFGDLWGADAVGLESAMRYSEDVSRTVLDGELGEDARCEEPKESEPMGAWKTVHRPEAYAVAGRAPLGIRWVDTDSGDVSNQTVRIGG